MPQALSQVLRQEIWQQRGKGTGSGAIAEALGISRRSVTRILARGVTGLKPSYQRCGGNGREYGEAVRTAAVTLKRAHPGWGAVVIQLELAKELGKTEPLPGERTLQSWFRRAGVAVKRERKPAAARPRGPRVHEVWEVDAKEQVPLGDHSRASVLMVVDEASGALVAATSFPLGQFNAVPVADIRDALRVTFEGYGLPEVVRVDNGGPWGKPQNTPSWLALWLAGLGIKVQWIRPGCPKDNPQIERCNGLIEPWSEPWSCPTRAAWQASLERMIERQRDKYPIAHQQSRTQLHPEFYVPRRPYRRQDEAALWQLVSARALLAQFSWQRVVSKAGQLTVMNQRFGVGRAYGGQTVTVTYDATDNVYVVHAFDGTALKREFAWDINTETICSLASTARQRKLGQTLTV